MYTNDIVKHVCYGGFSCFAVYLKKKIWFNLEQLLSPTERLHLQYCWFCCSETGQKVSFWSFNEGGVSADV